MRALEPGERRLLPGEEIGHSVYEDLIGATDRRRHVSFSDKMRSTHRLPLSLAVPSERLRHRTP